MSRTESANSPHARTSMPLDGVRYLFRRAGRYLSNAFKPNPSLLPNRNITPAMINERLRTTRHKNGKSCGLNGGAHAPEIR